MENLSGNIGLDNTVQKFHTFRQEFEGTYRNTVLSITVLLAAWARDYSTAHMAP